MYPSLLHYRLAVDHITKDSGLWLGYESGEKISVRNHLGRVSLEPYDSARILVDAHPNIFTLSDERGGSHLLFDASLPRPQVRTIGAELHADAVAQGDTRPLSDFELAGAVMAKGNEYSYYGHGRWRSAFEVLHLFACGIEWSEFKGVTSEVWSEFAGTFEDSDRQDVLEAKVMCRCALEIEVEFGIEPPAMHTIIVRLASDQLDELLSDD